MLRLDRTRYSVEFAPERSYKGGQHVTDSQLSSTGQAAGPVECFANVSVDNFFGVDLIRGQRDLARFTVERFLVQRR